MLEITLRRYRCIGCGHVWRQGTTAAAEPRSKLSRRALGWALEGLVVAHLSVARIAEALAVSWNTANSAVLAEGRRLLIDDPGRFDTVRVIGVDEQFWRHTFGHRASLGAAEALHRGDVTRPASHGCGECELLPRREFVVLARL